MTKKVAAQVNTVAASDVNNTINNMPVTPARKDNTMNNTNSGRTFTVCTTNKIYNNNYEMKHLTWEEALAKFSYSIKTTETKAEYDAMDGKQRTAVKDVGGFVAGELADGKRSNANLISRSMVTLDADSASADFWDNYKTAYPSVAACAYSTHSSTPEKLRLRLVIPLSRDVAPQEYEYIARSIADTVGMGNFDSSTFEAARHMFFPSCSCDATPYFRKNAGEPFDADGLLKMHPDWEDKATWSRHPDEPPQQMTMDAAAALMRPASVSLPAHTVSESSAPNAPCSVDTRAKKNIVGLFCAAYTVPEAIRTFLSHSYEPTTTKNRYSYIHASSYGGLLVSDDEVHAYSFHAHDPANRRWLNAFDLVRTHLYGNLDIGLPADTKMYARPSYKAMLALIAKDSKVSKKADELIRSLSADCIVLRNGKNILDVVSECRPGENPEFPCNDKGQSRLFAHVFHDQLVFCVDEQKWYCYDGIRWACDTSGLEVNEFAKKLADAMEIYALRLCRGNAEDKRHKALTCWNSFPARSRYIQDASGIHTIQFGEFDANPYILNVKNGTLELHENGTFTFREHRPEDFLTHCCDVDYVPGKRCMDFETFLIEVMASTSLAQAVYSYATQSCNETPAVSLWEAMARRDYLLRLLGYCLTGENGEECMFILYGSTTRNGKSTLVSAVLNVLGDYATTLDPAALAQGRTTGCGPNEELMSTPGKRFIDLPEASRNMLFDAGLLKRLTGGDRISARHVYGRKVQFPFTAKLMMNTNYLPEANDRTLFSSNRLIVVPFDRHFDEIEMDTTLKARFRAEEAKTGILNLLLKGYAEQCRIGIRQMPQSVAEETQKYADNSDKIKQFVGENLVKEQGALLNINDALDCYRAWCEMNGFLPESMKNFSPDLRANGLIIDRRRRGKSPNKETLIVDYELRLGAPRTLAKSSGNVIQIPSNYSSVPANSTAEDLPFPTQETYPVPVQEVLQLPSQDKLPA